MGKMYRLVYYVPPKHMEKVNDAIFKAGGGRIGNYDCCAWVAKGHGQFRPRDGSHPFIGHNGELERVVENKVELVCDGRHLKKVLAALVENHPYEEPAYQYWEVNKEGL